MKYAPDTVLRVDLGNQDQRLALVIEDHGRPALGVRLERGGKRLQQIYGRWAPKTISVARDRVLKVESIA